MDADARAMPERLRPGQQLQNGVGESRLLERFRGDQTLPPADFVHLDAAEVDRRSLARHRLIAASAMHLDATDLHGATARTICRRNHQLFVDTDPA